MTVDLVIYTVIHSSAKCYTMHIGARACRLVHRRDEDSGYARSPLRYGEDGGDARSPLRYGVVPA